MICCTISKDSAQLKIDFVFVKGTLIDPKLPEKSQHHYILRFVKKNTV